MENLQSGRRCGCPATTLGKWSLCTKISHQSPAHLYTRDRLDFHQVIPPLYMPKII